MTEPNSPNKILTELFPAMPPTLKSAIKTGYALLKNVSRDKWEVLLKEALQGINNPVLNTSSSQLSTIAAQLAMSEKEVSAVENAVLSISHSINNHPGIEKEAFLKAAISEGVLRQEEEDIAAQFFDFAVKRTEEIRNGIADTDESDNGLPTLNTFDISIDMKLKFDSNGISRMSPVAIVHLDTDSYLQEMWLQISPVQLRRIVSELNKVVEQMDMAEKASKEFSRLQKE